jgi:hypothetical protein
MRPHLRFFLITALFLCARLLFAEEGMWLLDSAPKLPLEQMRARGFTLDPADVCRPGGTGLMSAVVQLGGGTDINRAVAYCQGLVHDPQRTIFILITDLFEGGNSAELVRRMEALRGDGVRAMVMLALSDSGVPTYDEHLAKRLRNLGIPCFGCTPGLLPEFLSGALKGVDLEALAKRLAPG